MANLKAHEMRLAHEAKYPLVNQAALDAGNEINLVMARGMAGCVDGNCSAENAAKRDALYREAYGLDENAWKEMQAGRLAIYRAAFSQRG